MRPSFLYSNPLIPVVVVDSAEDGVAVGHALVEGGIHVAEVTFRTEAAVDAISEMQSIEGLTIGAGTVINEKQADLAIAAGAQFIVSPGFSLSLVEHVLDLNVPMIPACTDGSWIMAALGLGIDVIKFFPAEALGGPAAIKALSAPFSQVTFIPTGGITAENLKNYLSLDSVLSCGGSWMVHPDLVHSKRWDEIRALSKAAVDLALPFHEGSQGTGEK